MSALTIDRPPAKERVAAAATFLDEEYPGWHDRVELGNFDLFDPERCIGAYVTGDHEWGWERLRIQARDATRVDMMGVFSSPENERFWVSEIRARRAA